MLYNIKEISYPNGTRQIRVYSESIERFDDDFKSKYDFDDSYSDCDVDVDSSAESEKDTEEQKRARSFRRTKNKIYDYSRCVAWEWFVTFTINPDICDSYDYQEVTKKVRKWLNNIKIYYCPDLQYLIVPEQHKSGRWHFHGLFAQCGTLDFVDSGHVHNENTVFHLKQYKYGFNECTKVRDTKKVASYIGKYITKDISDFIPSRQRYFVSQNIPEPDIDYWYYDSFNFPDDDVRFEKVEEYIEFLATQYGDRITYIKQLNCDVVKKIYYFELQ